MNNIVVIFMAIHPEYGNLQQSTQLILENQSYTLNFSISQGKGRNTVLAAFQTDHGHFLMLMYSLFMIIFP
jgi:hypothetical protein